MKFIVFAASVGLGAAALAPACSANPLVVGRLIEGGTPSACASAGGTCVLNASVACATEAPGSVQDCSASNPLPGEQGARCCFTYLDASPDRTIATADAASESGNGGNNDGGNNDGGNSEGGGTSTCASAGGACLHANAQCAARAPAAAEDCNISPNPASDFCCLAVPDAGPDLDAGPADGGLGNDVGGNGDGGGTTPLCAAAGGSCITPSVGCALGAPAPAQDCPVFCCITKL